MADAHRQLGGVGWGEFLSSTPADGGLEDPGSGKGTESEAAFPGSHDLLRAGVGLEMTVGVV